MLAAVNAYQDFCGNPAGKAKPLKCQRRIFCEARRELSRAEYFRLLDATRRTGRKRMLLVLQTLCATGIRVSELRFITAEAGKGAYITTSTGASGRIEPGATVEAAFTNDLWASARPASPSSCVPTAPIPAKR